MAESGAIFGGEHSGHFYFRDFWFADSGMLAALHAIAALLDEGRPISEVMRPFDRYAMSGEFNTSVSDQASAIAAIRSEFEQLPNPPRFDELDGLTVAGDDWWFNVRPSNTEPLLRLNVEAQSHQAMTELRDRVLARIKSQ
jgi:phosphomannomutase